MALKKYYNITPEGTRDLLFEECGTQKKVEGALSRLFAGRGFTEVVTPTVEFLDVFQQKSSYIAPEKLYKTTDGKGRLIVLRPDSTIPIARLVSTRLKGFPLPIRLYYSQPVFSVNQSLSGRSDEVVQMGIEIIGSASKRADLEVISTAVEALFACDTSDFRLEIGHIGIFNTLIARFGIPEDAAEEIRRLIEIKNYPALNDLLDNMDCGEGAGMLKMLPRLFGGEEVFSQAEGIFKDETITGILRYLRGIYTALAELGLREKITVDLGIVNRNDYYTGIVFRGYVEGFGETALSGGRYDSLYADFGQDLPATGFGVNVDAIAKALRGREASGMMPDVLVHGEPGFEMKALLLCKELGAQGLTVENSVFDTLEQARAYGQTRGIPRLIRVSDTREEIAMKGAGRK